MRFDLSLFYTELSRPTSPHFGEGIGQREGIVLAKKRGAFRGRKKSLSPAAVAELRKRIAAGMSKAQAAREFGISRETLYKYLKEAERTPVV